SASRRMVTICSSVNRLFFMTSLSPLEAILSSFNWSENSRAGHAHLDGPARRAIWHDNALRVYRIALDAPHQPARG
ncbi:hypothetical protein SB377_15025, partial [Burkholderia sp. BCCIQ07D]|nr:hypothetical protein [Burkholderia anthinoferrum]MEB2561268.1 hypothetical protein [Burkholderia anthinoferrum]MEB2581082.1 hypothetical protein [Burkholderia anthinoferrum]